MANTIRDWVVALSYAVDSASQARFIQSAKQTTKAINDEGNKQLANQVTNSLRVQHFLKTASEKEIQAFRAHAGRRLGEEINASKQIAQALSAGNKQYRERELQAHALYQAAWRAKMQRNLALVAGYVKDNFGKNLSQAMATVRENNLKDWHAVVNNSQIAFRNIRNVAQSSSQAISSVLSVTRPGFMAVGTAAIAVGGNIGYLTNSLDKLYNLSKRTGSGASDIRALRQSLSMMGGSDAEADAMITSASNAILQRSNQGFLKGIGIDPNHPQGTVGVLEEFSKFIRQMPTDTAQQYGNVIGLSPEMIRYLQSGDFAKQMRINREELAKWGVDEERAKRAGKGLADEWRRFSSGFGAIDRKISTALIEGGGGLWGRLNKWMLDNAKAITTAGVNMSKGFTEKILGWGDKLLKIFETPESFEKFKKEASEWWERFEQGVITVKNAIVTIAEVLTFIAKSPIFTGLSGMGALTTGIQKEGGPNDAGMGGLATYLLGDLAGSAGSWLKNLFGISAEANVDASKDFKEGVGKFDKAVDKLTGGPMGGPGGVGGGTGGVGGGGASATETGTPTSNEGGVWGGIKGAFAGRSKALGGTGEGVISGFKGGYAGTGAAAGGVPNIEGMTDEERNNLGLILKYESNNRNVMNYAGRAQGLDPTTPKGYTAQGYYQILNSNWQRLAKGLNISAPNAMAASKEDQTRVALALMREPGQKVGHWANYNPALRAALARGEKATIPVPSTAPAPEEQSKLSLPSRMSALTDAMTEANKAGLETTSGYRSLQHRLSRRNPRSAHAQALAFDLRAKTEEQADAVMAKQREMMAAHGLEEGRDFKMRDEVRNPVGWGTGPHVHFQFTPEGSARYAAARQAKPAGPSILDRIKSTAGNVAKGVSDIVIPEAKSAARGFNPDRFDAVKSSGDFANPGRYIGPSQTTDNSKKIDFDAIYNTSINTTEPKQAATSFQRAHEQLNAMSQRQLQGMWR